MQKTNYRKGFKVNEKYKATKSYGTIDESEFEEAARIRNQWSGVVMDSAQKATRNVAAARKRMLRQRLKTKWSKFPPAMGLKGDRGKRLDPKSREAKRQSAGQSGAVGSVEREPGESSQAPQGDGELPSDSGGELPSDSGVGGGSAAAVGRSGVESNGLDEEAGFMGLADSAWQPRQQRASSLASSMGAPLPLTTAQIFVSNAEARRRATGAQLAAAAVALSEAKQHGDAAELLQELRDFGVERDVLQRRVQVEEAAALFEEASVQLGLELRLAGRLSESWRALLAACAEPQLGNRRKALSALTEVALKLAERIDPARQVEVLQGALDAELVSSSLPREKRDELQITLALALQSAGRRDESKDMLQDLARRASTPRRRQQAEWALMVQNVDLDGEEAAATREMRDLWSNVSVLDGTRGLGAGGSAVAAARRLRQGGGLFGVPSFRLGEGNLVFLVLLLPLSIPFLASLRADG